jgi:hypothetical protein
VTAALGLLFATGGASERAREACPGHAQEATVERMQRYRNLVAAYARGDRAPAVARLARMPELELCNIAHTLELAALFVQRGQEGAEAQLALQHGKLGKPPLSLQAAVMLHLEVELARQARPPGVLRRTEELRRCPGRQTLIASRYARLLAVEQDRDTLSFARRFFVALAHKCQWDACFDDADYWAREGLKLFPRDPELLFAGGSYSMRGFAQNAVGPIGPDLIPAGGNALVIFNNELRAPLFGRFVGVLFTDIGNVYPLISDITFDFRESAGVGLRVRTPWFLLRGDYGFVLDPRPGEKRQRFYFSIGQAF